MDKPQKLVTVFEEDSNCEVTLNKDVNNVIKSEEHSAAEGIVKDQSTDLIASLLKTQNNDTKEDIKLGKLLYMLYSFKNLSCFLKLPYYEHYLVCCCRAWVPR